jgi:hypothetical protein
MNFDAYHTIADISFAYDIYFLGLLWLIGVSAYLFALILFDSPEKLDDHT